MRTEDRGQRTEDRRQRTEDRGQRTEDRASGFARSPRRDKQKNRPDPVASCLSRSGVPPSTGGSALIVAIWVIGLLALLVGSFAFDARIEARIISYYKKRSKAVYLAKSGVELATMLMNKSRGISPGSADSAETADDPWFDQALRLSRGLGTSIEHELGDGKILLEIVPEPARRNINNLGGNDAERERNLERILNVGGITEDTGLWPVLIESFLDWTDKDDTPRVDGAETHDYYSALTNSYKAKNGPLDTVGELLLVKGYNRTILYGGVIDAGVDAGVEGEEGPRISGIHDLLTTYGDGKVNVNAANERVLRTLPGVDDLTAKAIREEREGLTIEGGADDETDYSFRSVGDFTGRIPGLDPSVKNYVTTASSIYRITSVGSVGDVKKKVWCIGKYTGNNLVILRWREED